MADRHGRQSRVYALDPGCRVYLDGRRLILVTAELATVVSGSATPGIIADGLSLLDGTRTQAQIAAQLRVPVEQWCDVVDRVVEARLAAPVEEPPDPRDGLGTLVDALVGGAAESPVPSRPDLALIGANTALVDEISRAWSAAAGSPPTVAADLDGLPGPAALTVVAVTTSQQCQEVNAALLRLGRPWLLVEPCDGEVVTVGPLVLPGQTCCAECVRVRRTAHAPYDSPGAQAQLVVPARLSTTPAIVRLQADLVTYVAAVQLRRPDASAVGVLHALDLRTMRTSQHRVLRVPRCPVCSRSAGRPLPFPWTRSADVAV